MEALTADSEKIGQINLLKGKAKNLLKATTLVYAHFIKLFDKMATCPK